MKFHWLIGYALFGWYMHTAWADATPQLDLIPELKDIEKIAAEQEAAIRAQSEALKKAQDEKEAAAKAAQEALERKHHVEKTAATSAPVTTPVVTKPVVAKKAATKKIHAPAPVDPWLAQERRYSYP